MTRAEKHAVRLARVQWDPEPGAGRRILVDRLWPRGISKERAALDRWLKEVAPSTELRRWYGHDPERYEVFVARYEEELAQGAAAEALAELREEAAGGPLVLLSATKELDLSHATVLEGLLRG